MSPTLWPPPFQTASRRGSPAGRVRLPWWAWILMAAFGVILGIGLVSLLESEDGGPGPEPAPLKKKRGPRRLVLSAASAASRATKITVRPIAVATGAVGEPLPTGLLLTIHVVESSSRKPIDAASVRVRAPGGEDYEAYTGGDGVGEIRIPVWPVKSVSLSAQADGYQTAASREIALPEKAHQAEVTMELIPPLRVSGFVRAAGSQQPIVGAEVSLTSQDPLLAESGWEVIDTDARGYYSLELESLPAQGLVFTARARGFLPEVRENPGGRGEVHQDFELEAEAAIRGRVVDAVNGRPVAGANVGLVASRPEFADMGGSAVSEDDGSFELDLSGVPRSCAWVFVQADGHSPAAIALPHAGGELVVAVGPVVFLRGRVKVPGEFGFHEDFTVTAAPRDLYGQALGQDMAEADVEGEYELELLNVPPDHADILVESSSGVIRSSKPTPFSGTAADAPQGTLDITVTLPFKMTGTVTGTADGSPVPRALVRIASKDPRYPDVSAFTTTDEEGRYSLEIAGIPRDSLEVWVEDGEMQYQAGGLEVPDDAETWNEDLTIDRE